ncbi:Retrovirus-related Pol polyprotein from transposon 17.6 [Eumeta japonica]|uniref:Retrovirus-related Pol polyprotein from transposon 17.6 n=1 Tax=Eumeta variegata TaxID=151549 RepID=A0A4C1XLI6_EUMVA|nr:Retrovirus-related Pol polyprotein from transposon 17.6 [Eumeta japonica]
MKIKGNHLKLGNNTIELNYNSEDIDIDLENLFQQYQKIFTENVTDSVTTKTKHEIKLTDDSPIYQRPFRLPQTQRTEIKKQLKKLLKENIIRPSDSPWASPVHLVPKKLDNSGQLKFRLVIDYRKLNEKTQSDRYPLPNIEDILTQLNNSKYFSTIDLTSGYPLVKSIDDTALGAVLSQNQHPIAYASRTLSETGRRYNTTEKELLAMLWACQHFRPYIYGRKFQLETDHQPLTWLAKLKESNAKLTRWRLRLQEFDYDIGHTKGRQNKVADTLSRIELQNNDSDAATVHSNSNDEETAEKIEGNDTISYIRSLTKIIRYLGKPKHVRHDPDKLIDSLTFKEHLTNLLAIDVHQTSARHHTSNGDIERAHSTIIEKYRVMRLHPDEDKEELMALIITSYNCTEHSVAECTPHQALFGIEPNQIEIPGEALLLQNYNKKRYDLLKSLHNNIIDNMDLAKGERLKRDNRKRKMTEPLEKGTSVYIPIHKHRRNKKEPPFVGPYPVIEALPRNTYLILGPRNHKTKYHKDELRITESPSAQHGEPLQRSSTPTDH